jgi:sigma-B regulation protein RsbU (phosphoserine phosphatase)
LPEVLETVAATLGEAGIEAARMHDAQVIVEELVCNVMDHGTASGVDALSVDVSVDGGRVVLDIRDNGAAYDPLAHPPPDLEADIGERPIGGLGIHLVRELAQVARYRREDGWNILCIELDAILPQS